MENEWLVGQHEFALSSKTITKTTADKMNDIS